MSYPVRKGILQKHWRATGFALLGVWCLLLVLGYLEVLQFTSALTKMIPTAVLITSFMFFLPSPDQGELTIEEDRLRLGAKCSYPIEVMTRIHVHSREGSEAKLRIKAKGMDTIRTAHVANASQLVAELHSINPEIEVIDETASA